MYIHRTVEWKFIVKANRPVSPYAWKAFVFSPHYTTFQPHLQRWCILVFLLPLWLLLCWFINTHKHGRNGERKGRVGGETQKKGLKQRHQCNCWVLDITLKAQVFFLLYASSSRYMVSPYTVTPKFLVLILFYLVSSCRLIHPTAYLGISDASTVKVKPHFSGRKKVNVKTPHNKRMCFVHGPKN